MVNFHHESCTAAQVPFLLSFFSDRIRLYKSGSRGSVLKKVTKNVPDATQLLRKFKGGTSRRVYIILKNDDENGGTDTWLFHLLSDI